MYILVKGEVGVYVDEDLASCIAVLQENKVFGERALQQDEPRGACVRAHKDSLCLLITRKEFKKVVQVIKETQRTRRQSFLSQLPFFSS